MKKVLLVISMMILTGSITAAHSTTSTTDMQSKKHHKKHHRCAAKIAIKDKAVAKDGIVATVTNSSWMDNLSGSLAFTSNYMFRGVSQSTNLPAVQGGITYTFPIGIYLSLWGSNVRFVGQNAQVEIDTIAGYRGTFANELSYDLNIARYNYPGARLLNYNEANTLFNYKFLQFGYSYSANVYNTHGTGIYYSGGINYAIPSQYIFGVEDLTLIALIGHYSLPPRAGKTYKDFNISLTKKLNKTYSIMAQWTNTNGRLQNSPYDGNTYIAQVNATF